MTLTDELVVSSKRHLEVVRTLHERDLASGFGTAFLPHVLAVKYPNAARQCKW